MPSEKKKLTIKGLINKILELHPNIRDASSRQQARITVLASMFLALASLIIGIVAVILGQYGLFFSMLGLGIIMGIATIVGRTDNFQAGSIIMVCGMILIGFILSPIYPNASLVLIIATSVPAMIFSAMLLPIVAVIIISVVKLLAIGSLPLLSIGNVSIGLVLFLSFLVIDPVAIGMTVYREVTENRQTEELGNLSARLEERVEERTRYTRIVADISQEVAASSTLEELLGRAVSQVATRLHFVYVGIYLVDETGHTLDLKASEGSQSDRTFRPGRQVAVGSQTILGWVSENKQQRIAAKNVEDPLELKIELVPEGQAEAGVPIVSKDQLIGVLDVQSVRSTIFDNETIVVLQMLADQIATAIQNVRLFEIGQGSIHEEVEVYLASHRIAQVKTDSEILKAMQDLFRKTSYISMYLVPQGNELGIVQKTNISPQEEQNLPKTIAIPIEELEPFMGPDVFIAEGSRLGSLPYEMVRVLRQLQLFSVALIPVKHDETVLAILLIGVMEKTPLSITSIRPVIHLAEQIATTLINIRETQSAGTRISELEAIASAGSEFTQAKSDREILEAVQHIFPGTPTSAILLLPENDVLRITASATPTPGEEMNGLPETLKTSPDKTLEQIGKQIMVDDVSKLSAFHYAQFHPELKNFVEEEAGNLPTLDLELIKLVETAQFNSVAFIPITRDENMLALIIVGTQSNQSLPPVESYVNVNSLVVTILERIRSEEQIKNHLSDENDRLHEETRDRSLQLQAAAEIGQAMTDQEVYGSIQHMFLQTPYAAILFVPEANGLRVVTSADPNKGTELAGLPERLDVESGELLKQLGNNILIEEVSKLSALHYAQFHPDLQKFIEDESRRLPLFNPELLKLFETAQFNRVAFIPVTEKDELVTLILLGTLNDQPISSFSVDLYAGLSEMIRSALDRIRGEQETEHRLNEDEAIILVSQEITSVRDLPTLYRTLHSHIRQTLGDVNFLVATYDNKTNAISVPYLYEHGVDSGEVNNKIETFPLGEGLTSILIRTKQPLMLVSDTENRAAALGAKIVGRAPKSWLGTPLIVSGDAIGAIVVQDVEQEYAFSDGDMRFLTTLSAQVAGTIYNARLLEESRSRALQLQTAAEIARDISGSLDLGELLSKAVILVRDRFNFYHAAIFLVDAANEYALIREATGDAGTQMKRASHKLKVGSKSIVGYVTGSGEILIVNDTSRDATYYANPLLPETRAEIAIPLKVGTRILGALDVQSVESYSFSEENVNVLRILADQLAIALINTELFADSQEHLSQHRLLHHVTTAAASGTTLEESLKGATQGLQVTLGGDRVTILLTDKDKKKLVVRAYAGYSEEISQIEIPIGEGVTGWVAAHQQPLRINDVSKDPRYLQMGSNVQSELAIPLTYRGELLGVLNVESDQIGAYNENDEEMLGTLAGSLAAIISNARLIEQVRRQVDRERTLYEVTSKIRRSTDMQTIMATTTSELTKALGARRAQIKIDVENKSDQDESQKQEG